MLTSAVALLLALATATVTAEEGETHCPVSVVGAGFGGAFFAYRLCVDTATYACSGPIVSNLPDSFMLELLPLPSVGTLLSTSAALRTLQFRRHLCLRSQR